MHRKADTPRSERDTPAPADQRALFGGGRLSPQRSSIAATVLELDAAFTAEELHRRVLERAPGVGLATVYRALGAMLEAGTVAEMGARDGSTLFARCGRDDHHHHLVCNSCGAVVAIECPFDGDALHADTGGALVISHEIVFRGLCGRCRSSWGTA